MAFRGLYEHSLDSKDRLTVPSRFRASLADGIVLSKGFDLFGLIEAGLAIDKTKQEVKQGKTSYNSAPLPSGRKNGGNTFCVTPFFTC